MSTTCPEASDHAAQHAIRLFSTPETAWSCRTPAQIGPGVSSRCVLQDNATPPHGAATGKTWRETGKQRFPSLPLPPWGGDSSNLSRLPITTDNGRDPVDYPEHQDPADLYRADGAVAVPGWEDHNSSRCPCWSQRCLQEVAFTCSPQVLLAGSPQRGGCTFRSSGGNSRQLFFFLTYS